jgi:hypothetical protein
MNAGMAYATGGMSTIGQMGGQVGQMGGQMGQMGGQMGQMGGQVGQMGGQMGGQAGQMGGQVSIFNPPYMKAKQDLVYVQQLYGILTGGSNGGMDWAGIEQEGKGNILVFLKEMLQDSASQLQTQPPPMAQAAQYSKAIGDALMVSVNLSRLSM